MRDRNGNSILNCAAFLSFFAGIILLVLIPTTEPAHARSRDDQKIEEITGRPLPTAVYELSQDYAAKTYFMIQKDGEDRPLFCKYREYESCSYQTKHEAAVRINTAAHLNEDVTLKGYYKGEEFIVLSLICFGKTLEQ